MGSLLRKWKINSFLTRWEVQKSKIHEVDEIEDYVTEMQDEGWKVSVNTRNNIITFKCSDHPISRMNSLFNFLTHNHRLGFKLRGLNLDTSSVTVKVEYKVRPKVSGTASKDETTDDKIRKMAEDDDRLDDPDDTADRIRRLMGE